jgi:hypothetical protein
MVSVILSVAACRPLTVPMEHVVMMDSDGTPVDPRRNIGKNNMHGPLFWYDQLDDNKYDEHLTGIIAGIKKFSDETGKRKIMLYIHGGMNSQLESLERMVEPFDEDKNRIALTKEEGYYPIFINWNSSLWSSYFEHLFWIRQGKRWSWHTGLLSSLIIFPVDLIRSFVRAPLVWVMQLYNDGKSIPADIYPPTLSDKISAELICRYYGDKSKGCPDEVEFVKPPKCFIIYKEDATRGKRPERRKPTPDSFPIHVGEDKRECKEMVFHFWTYFLTLPFKLAISPILDTLGTSAWENMSRRTHLLFHTEEEMTGVLTQRDSDKHALSDIPASGGVSKLMERLIREKEQDNRPWEIVLVGHSMGTIVVNEIIRSYGSKLPITDIIYIAAASSIADYEISVFPYLQTHKVNAYHFMLHPQTERRERQFPDLAPRGSLLEWLDHFLADPPTVLDRTVGRYHNFMPAIHDTPADIRSRIHLRVYSAGRAVRKNNPESHHEISDRFKYWRPACWEVNATLDACIKSKAE